MPPAAIVEALRNSLKQLGAERLLGATPEIAARIEQASEEGNVVFKTVAKRRPRQGRFLRGAARRYQARTTTLSDSSKQLEDNAPVVERGVASLARKRKAE